MLTFRFGYENKYVGLIKAALAIALGTYLIATKANAMELVVQIIAGVILLANVFSFLLALKFPALQQSSGSLFSLVLALPLFVLAEPISTVLRYIIGGFLFLAGGSQVLSHLGSGGARGMGYFSLSVSVLMILGGCLFFSEELIGNDIMGLMVGVAILMYGVSKLLRVLKLNKLFSGKKGSDEQTYIKQEKPQETPWQSFGGGQVKDVDYEKVDEQ